MSLFCQFVVACSHKDESKAKSLLERNPWMQNDRNINGITVLMVALKFKCISLARWLLSLPGLDTSSLDVNNFTTLHWACVFDAPLDIVATLARLSSWETVNMVDRNGNTALDRAVVSKNTSAALYLSWLGAKCRAEFRNCYNTGEDEDKVVHNFTEVNLQTWIEAGCQQDAQYWAVAANDLNALKHLAKVENVRLDRVKLRNLAKLFNHRKMWSYSSSLESLAWEELKLKYPALVNNPPEKLLGQKVPSHVVGVIFNCKEEYKEFADNSRECTS